MPGLKDLAGKTSGRLTVQCRAGSAWNGEATWVCLCACGESCVVAGSKITSGRTMSCGCLRAEARQSVLQAVETLERMGSACYSAGRPQKGDVRESAPGKHLRRAVQYGLATRSKTKPYVYRAVEGWRDALKPLESPKFARLGRPVASVWDLARA